MKRHAKASSARSTQRQGGAIVVMALVLLALVSSSAFAATTRPYTGVSFGPDGAAGTESFTGLRSIAVDQASGDVYVYAYGEFGEGTVSKFDSSGEPVAFSGLAGSNTIEGVGASGEAGVNQVAVAPLGSPGGTAGDIYVANDSIVKVYSAAGIELGTLGEGETCGVAVDPAGHLFIGTYALTIREYVPSANPPTDTDLANSGFATIGLCNVAADGAGNVYATNYNGEQIAELEGLGDEHPTLIEPGARTIGVDPVHNRLFVPREGKVLVYDSSATQVETFGSGELSEVPVGVAANAAAEEVYVGDPDSGKIKVFGPPVPLPDVTTQPATDLTNASVTLHGEVSAAGGPATSCLFEFTTEAAFQAEGFEGAQTVACTPPGPFTGSSTEPVSAELSGLSRSTAYRFRLTGSSANGVNNGQILRFETASSVITEPANPVGVETATLNGLVHPEGLQYSECKFEFGLTTNPGFESEVPCTPAAASIPPGAIGQAVSAEIAGLDSNTTYRFRLTATNSAGTISGPTLTFTTGGRPVITEPRASFADQSSATLGAEVDPRGFETIYFFEWGPTSSYGNIAPVGPEPSIGSGTAPVSVSTRITGLAAGTVYHYRIVAENAKGSSASPDQKVETLNSCGLPEGRCFELVSRQDAGPVASSKADIGDVGGMYATPSGPGEVVYSVEGGYPDATRGAGSLWLAKRAPSGWDPSTQFTAPTVGPGELASASSGTSFTKWVSPDLSCVLQQSSSVLTADPGVRLTVEAGQNNLYRRNTDGSYSAITTLPLTNAAKINAEDSIDIFVGFGYVGASGDCSTVAFMTKYYYPAIPGKGEAPLYEWDHGTLRNVGMVPGPDGEVLVAGAALGGPDTGTIGNSALNTTNAVSENGSRIFFTAMREISPNPAEVGKQAVFAREDGTRTIDVSLSETATPDSGASYMEATPDGSRVFFTANAGLTDEGSVEGTDLYEYDFEKPEGERLADLSVSGEPGGAQVAGMLGASDDGSHVYFAARGQLLPGRGNTYAENQSADTYSIYGESDGSLDFVGTATNQDLRGGAMVNVGGGGSHVSPDGRFLLFGSSAKVTGFESGGVRQAYLYDTEATSEAVICVSCRSDGKPPVPPLGGSPLGGSEKRNLVVREGEPVVFFKSSDPLAPGAVEGGANVYEWSHGQVFRLAGQVGEGPVPGFKVSFGNASEDGSDAYFTTAETLSWEDSDGRNSVYDARIGGGFPGPPAPPTGPCDPMVEGSCQGSTPGGATVPGAASTTFNGPGNPKAHKKKAHKKHHKKKSKKHGKKKGSGKKARHANGNRRAGK